MPAESNQTELARTIDALWKSMGFSSRSAFWDAAGITNKTYWNKRLDGTISTAKKHIDQLVKGLRQAGHTITPQQEADLRTAIGMAVTINPEPPANASVADAIARRLIDILRPMPLTYRTAVQRMVEDYDTIFGGRDIEIAALDTFLDQDNQPCMLLLAPTGRGKTSLLIHWIAQVQVRGDWTVIFVPISRRYQIATAETVLGSLAHTLATFHGESLLGYNTSPDQLRPMIADYLRKEIPAGRRLLLVLDGLDESVGWKFGRDLFPRTFGPYLRVVAAARQMAQRSRDDWLDTLGWDATQTLDLALPVLSRDSIADILRRMDVPLNTPTHNTDVLAEIERISQGDPLTIKFLVERLQNDQLSLENMISMPPSLEAYVKDWLKELQRHIVQNDAIYILLCLCAVAHAPLSSADIQALAPETFQRRVTLLDAVEKVSRFLIGEGTEQSGYVFSHNRLRELFLEKILSRHERTQFQQRFVAYGHVQYRQMIERLSQEQLLIIGNPFYATSVNHFSFPTYLRQFRIVHLAEAGAWDLARVSLTEVVPFGDRFVQPWAQMRFSVEGSYTGYLADLTLLWQHAELRRDLILCLHCALIASSIHSLSGNLSPKLLVGLVMVGTPEGKWSPITALEHVRQMPDAKKQSTVLTALLRSGCDLPYPQTLDVVRAIADEYGRANVLIALASYVPPEFLPEALALARTITPAKWRAEALTQFALRLPPVQQLEAFTQALNAISEIVNGFFGAWEFGNLAPYLPATLFPTALEIISKISDTRERGRAMAKLAPYLPSDLLSVALKLARNIDDETGQLEALVALAPRLPITIRRRVCAQVLNAADMIFFEPERAEILASLAPHLSPIKQMDVYSKALALVEEIDIQFRVETLAQLAPRLPKELLPVALEIACAFSEEGGLDEALEALAPYIPPTLLSRALEVARSITNEYGRSQALGAIARHLPSMQQSEVYTQALDSAIAIEMDHWRTEALVRLVPHLPSTLLSVASQIAYTIREPESRTKALETLVPHLTPSHQPDMYAQLLANSRIIDDVRERAGILTALAPYLPPTLQSSLYRRASVDIHRISDEQDRVKVVSALVPHISSDLLSEILDSARIIEKEYIRAEIIVALAPYLPSNLLSASIEVAFSIDSDISRVQVLTALGSHLPSNQQPDVFAQALTVARSITSEHDRVWALALLCQDLSVDNLSSALQIARTIESEYWRGRALWVLAPHLPTSLLLEALEIANAISGDGMCAAALAALVPYLPDTYRVDMVAHALDASRAITSGDQRVWVLTNLTTYLPPEQQLSIHIQSVEAINAIYLATERAEAIAALAPHLPSTLMSRVLQITCMIDDEASRALALTGVASYLPSELLPAALEAAYALTNQHWQVEALALLAPYSSPSQQLDLYARVLTTIRSIAQESVSIRMLPIFGMFLPPIPASDTYGQSLAAIRAIAYDDPRVRALGALASHLPPTLLPEALEIGCMLTNSYRRARTLGMLAPYMASTLSGMDSRAQFHCHTTIRMLAKYDRRGLLSSLEALMPWLITIIEHKSSADIIAAIDDVVRCWP